MIYSLQISLHGAVQGVGFRPFVYRLAKELGLTGWVNNSSQGVTIEVEGEKEKLEQFMKQLMQEKPPHALIQNIESTFSAPKGHTSFEITSSKDSGEKTTLVLPDIAACDECLSEIFNQSDRRYLYPFTNCTNCGPRFTIIESLPYDRPGTTMKYFTMCKECQAEYDNPLDRRFHAQPNACPKCGPIVELWDKEGTILASSHQAILKVTEAVRKGQIIAIKGLGGFHLIADAANEDVVRQLRVRKHREEKPFALMFPSLEKITRYVELSKLEEKLLCSPQSPIVLLKKLSNGKELAPSIAPNNPYLGIMLPYTPLHHILLHELNIPIVATSGNLSDEPICIDELEALCRLKDIAGLFLVHNRPIVRHVDDSIARVILNDTQILRRARGYAPLPIYVNRKLPQTLAVGAHQKNNIALSAGQNIFISQHIGDLETEEAFNALKQVVSDFQQLYSVTPPITVCDLHPDYLSTRFAKNNSSEVIPVQHHIAHLFSCMAEHNLQEPALGVIWDGTGYGMDNTIWGGEFLLVENGKVNRTAYLRQFKLPGGEKAAKEPRRSALGILFELFGNFSDLPPVKTFSETELKNIYLMLKQGVNSPRTSSAGRLFDAVTSLTGLMQIAAFEGQAAMALEFALEKVHTFDKYDFEINRNQTEMIVNWEPMINGIISDVKDKLSSHIISAKFHNTLVDIIVNVAKKAGKEQVVLSGGCFQNKYLTEKAVLQLQKEGFVPYWNKLIPPNDGGIAFGQVAALSYLY